MIKNYGLIVEPLAPEDWKFGSSGLGMEIRLDNGDWTKFLPVGEKQKRQDVDKMACVTFSALSTNETEFIYQIENNLINTDDLAWLKEIGYLDENGKPDFSDRFIAILSDTTRDGNSFKRVADTIRKFGLIPEKLLPYRKDMSWDEFYNKAEITQELRNLGQEFLKRFPVNYEFVTSDYSEARKRNPLQVAIHAYNGMDNGVYVRTNNPFNHAVENNKRDQIFDSYEPFIKNLAPDFIYMSYSTRFIISFKKKEAVPENEPLKENNMTFYKMGKDIFLRSPSSGQYHRVGDEPTFFELFGRFVDNQIEDRNIAPSYIGEPIYLGTSLLKLLVSFVLKLKGKK